MDDGNVICINNEHPEKAGSSFEITEEANATCTKVKHLKYYYRLVYQVI